MVNIPVQCGEQRRFDSWDRNSAGERDPKGEEDQVGKDDDCAEFFEDVGGLVQWFNQADEDEKAHGGKD